jgi:hypothetical protein
LALTSPTGGGRSVGIVRWRTNAPVFVYYYYYSFIYTANGVLPGGSVTTIRHNTQITHITQNNTLHSKHSTQNYTSNEGHTTQNEYNANTIYNYNKNVQCYQHESSPVINITLFEAFTATKYDEIFSGG